MMSDATQAFGTKIILASQSRARRAMLAAAGVRFECVAADVDEGDVRARLMGFGRPVESAELARTLAEEKALKVSRAHPDALVIGADQVLALGRRIYSKVNTFDEARLILESLRGRKHELVSVAALASNGKVIWHGFDCAEMEMRNFSDAFLEDYLEQADGAILSSVGCYQIEALGVQLFDQIHGDTFTILGLPLFALLAELRNLGVMQK